MKSLHASTKRKVSIYLKAAASIARWPENGTCCAVFEIQHGRRNDGYSCDELDLDPVTSAYIDTMSEGGGSSAYSDQMYRAYGWDATPEKTDHRILALCFMAAMVEAGDICFADSKRK